VPSLRPSSQSPVSQAQSGGLESRQSVSWGTGYWAGEHKMSPSVFPAAEIERPGAGDCSSRCPGATGHQEGGAGAWELSPSLPRKKGFLGQPGCGTACLRPSCYP
jgi:hypothetical protein